MLVRLHTGPVRRLARFEPDHRPAAELLGAPVVRNGVTFRESLPPGPERDAAIAKNLEDFARRAKPLQAKAEELRTLVTGHEPVGLLLGIVVPGGMGVAGGDDAGSTVMWSAQVEYLVGLATSAQPATTQAPVEVIRRAGRLLRAVFDAAHARHMYESLNMQLTGADALDAALFLLRGEHLFDRMDGYATHLAQIDAEVFDRHRAAYVDTIGFNPADVHRVVRSVQWAGNDRLNEARDRFAQHQGVDDDAARDAFAQMLASLERSRIWEPDDVAATTGVPVAEVLAMLGCFSTTFGAQPEFRLPTDKNLARPRPAIARSDGTYLVADSWALTGAVHLRMAELANTGGTFPKYRTHRENGHQRVVTAAFRRVFGDTVHEGQHYTSKADGPGEIDTLVAGSWPLIVEAKAHGLTPAGRRGAPARVADRAKDILTGSFTQTARAHRYVMDEGGRAFALTENGELIERLPEIVDGVTDVVVTFERIDPLAVFAQGLTGEPGRPVWVVNAADLLMVIDVLDDPASFHHYIRTRAATAAAEIGIYVEADALGGYLNDRLSSQLDQAATYPDAHVMLGYSSGAINEHFTLAEIQQPTTVPVTGVPPVIAAALAVAHRASAPGWVAAVDAVMSTAPAVWAKWHRFLRRHRSMGRPFQVTEHMTLVPADESALATDRQGFELRVQV